MMRAIVLGGASEIGSRAVRALAADPEVERVMIADRRLTAGWRLAYELGADGVHAMLVDADNRSRLVQALGAHDVALGTIGPFYRFEPQLGQCGDRGRGAVREPLRRPRRPP